MYCLVVSIYSRIRLFSLDAVGLRVRSRDVQGTRSVDDVAMYNTCSTHGRQGNSNVQSFDS